MLKDIKQMRKGQFIQPTLFRGSVRGAGIGDILGGLGSVKEIIETGAPIVEGITKIISAAVNPNNNEKSIKDSEEYKQLVGTNQGLRDALKQEENKTYEMIKPDLDARSKMLKNWLVYRDGQNLPISKPNQRAQAKRLLRQQVYGGGLYRKTIYGTGFFDVIGSIFNATKDYIVPTIGAISKGYQILTDKNKSNENKAKDLFNTAVTSVSQLKDPAIKVKDIIESDIRAKRKAKAYEQQQLNEASAQKKINELSDSAKIAKDRASAIIQAKLMGEQQKGKMLSVNPTSVEIQPIAQEVKVASGIRKMLNKGGRKYIRKVKKTMGKGLNIF